MRGTIDVVLGRQRNPGEYQEALSSVGEDVDHLRALVEDLLLLARADAGRITLGRAPVRLDRLAAEVVDSFAESVEGAAVDLIAECADPVLVVGDERWLRQVLVNLVDNAVKFSNGAGIVRVGTKVEAGSGVLLVSDSGCGLPPEATERLFERFYRGDESRSYGSTPGFGLGLAIAAWVVEAHGGTISAQERPERGTQFCVRLPLAESWQGAAATPESAHEAEASDPAPPKLQGA
jgi:signal transduction histidine kinase